MHELKTFLITTIPPLPAFLAAVDNPSTKSIFTAFILPICFFVVSKSIDVILQFYFKKRGK